MTVNCCHLDPASSGLLDHMVITYNPLTYRCVWDDTIELWWLHVVTTYLVTITQLPIWLPYPFSCDDHPPRRLGKVICLTPDEINATPEPISVESAPAEERQCHDTDTVVLRRQEPLQNVSRWFNRTVQ